MYTEETIVSLSERMGFGTPLEDGFTIELDEANSVGSTGRLFKSFHQLVTVDNIYAALPALGTDATTKFNTYLEELRYQATLEVVPLIMDKHQDYDSAVSYDSIIDQNAILFDDAIGFKVAMMVLELFMTTKESNFAERNAKLSINNLKLELEGFRSDSGVLVARGLVQKFDRAVSKASAKIFPFTPKVDGTSLW
jgi:hypothetical protein